MSPLGSTPIRPITGRHSLAPASCTCCVVRLSCDVIGFVTLAVPFSTAISATVGVASLCSAGVHPWSSFTPLWETWWLGDTMGDLVMAPLLFTWAVGWLRPPSHRKIAEGCVLLLALTSMSFVVFDGRFAAVTTHHPLEYTVFPFVIWAALRFGPPLATLSIFVASGIAIAGTLRGFGPFTEGTAQENLVLLQIFLAVVTVTGLGLAVAVAERTRAEQARSHLAAIVESSHDAVTGKTLDGIITDWNAGAERLYGYAAEEVKGKLVSLLMPPDRQDEQRTILERIARGEEIEHYETVRVRKDGRRIDVSVSVSPINDAAGRIAGASTIARDISEHKQAERALRQSHAILNAVTEGTSDAIFVKNLQGKYLMINSAGARLLGKSIEEVIGKDDRELFSSETANPIMEADQRVMEGGLIRTYEEQGTAAGVTWIYLSTKGHPFPVANRRPSGLRARPNPHLLSIGGHRCFRLARSQPSTYVEYGLRDVLWMSRLLSGVKKRFQGIPLAFIFCPRGRKVWASQTSMKPNPSPVTSMVPSAL
jgi:PAS domain S-box-containing protein